ncbi:GNAT family N-acetyltransferase [uncultured Roseobacter sp.]|uniref:GNAT family N-acetyltransferase n=1 Tax=uncultured Roseobacter sp. TaxID=114847 RepID=UPI0026243F67|nr:GNAT family N-acetyltransferase [uncultured Roseobacter sp.]
MKIRDATKEDVAEMSAFLQQLAALGKRTSRSDPAFVLSNYIHDPNKVQCAVAEDADGTILGFQSLKVAMEANIYGVEPGWGIIGTHIRPDAARRGVGRALFAATREAAQRSGLTKIDASIAATNPEGLAYYEAMGFRSYRTSDGTICKCLDLTS